MTVVSSDSDPSETATLSSLTDSVTFGSLGEDSTNAFEDHVNEFSNHNAAEKEALTTKSEPPRKEKTAPSKATQREQDRIYLNLLILIFSFLLLTATLTWTQYNHAERYQASLLGGDSSDQLDLSGAEDYVATLSSDAMEQSQPAVTKPEIEVARPEALPPKELHPNTTNNTKDTPSLKVPQEATPEPKEASPSKEEPSQTATKTMGNKKAMAMTSQGNTGAKQRNSEKKPPNSDSIVAKNAQPKDEKKKPALDPIESLDPIEARDLPPPKEGKIRGINNKNKPTKNRRSTPSRIGQKGMMGMGKARSNRSGDMMTMNMMNRNQSRTTKKNDAEKAT